MITLVIGGSGSGKSAYAESLLEGVPQKYYLATMLVENEESKKKVERHQMLREGKGYVTIEQPRRLDLAADKIRQYRKWCETEGDKPAGALLECVSNLTANEMFQPEGMRMPRAVADDIISGISAVSAAVEMFVIVSNNVFEDGIEYDAGTRDYIKAMGMINETLAQMADRIVEVVAGIPVVWKE